MGGPLSPDVCDPKSDDSLDALIVLASKSAGWVEGDARYLLEKIDELTSVATWPRRLDDEPKTWERFCREVLGYDAQYFEEIREGVSVLERSGKGSPTVQEAHAVGSKERGRNAADKTNAKDVRPRGNRTGNNQYRRTEETGNFPVSSQQSRASESGISDRTQRKLDQLALDRPDLHEQVKSGARSVDAAYREAKGKPRRVSIDVEPAAAARVLRRHFRGDALRELITRLEETPEEQL
jgi:hypothetical protein